MFARKIIFPIIFVLAEILLLVSADGSDKAEASAASFDESKFFGPFNYASVPPTSPEAQKFQQIKAETLKSSASKCWAMSKLLNGRDYGIEFQPRGKECCNLRGKKFCRNFAEGKEWYTEE